MLGDSQAQARGRWDNWPRNLRAPQRAEVKARTLGGVALTSTACLDCPITLRADPTPGTDPFGNDRSPSGRRF